MGPHGLGLPERPQQSRWAVHKSAVQLQQEAVVVLAQGVGFQLYYQPTRAAYLDDRHVGVMERVAKFCREREKFCHQSETVPEIGVVFSKHSLHATANKLFAAGAAT